MVAWSSTSRRWRTDPWAIRISIDLVMANDRFGGNALEGEVNWAARPDALVDSTREVRAAWIVCVVRFGKVTTSCSTPSLKA